jgi:hypothetical protein
MTIQTDTFENADAEKPISSDVTTSHSVSKKIDSSTEKITLTTAMNGKIHTNTVTAQVPSVRMSSEGLTDEELVEKFFMSKVRGGAKLRSGHASPRISRRQIPNACRGLNTRRKAGRFA